ncbi:putative reverse transcriptase [Apostichopus japonicus]|uniref:Putative reverse transcriptase n=1 Tax=Stichopus japonicus TaxID=307972 RepID=A0A2G8KC04_STIJA|nr:putative reverse transcriptase [Apostichopus japonicus]
MPCAVYGLPKDHKEGHLKCRPIHPATDTPATKLSKSLAYSLTQLLDKVPAHLRNCDDFLRFLDNIKGQNIHGFCSLDVSNLYGSIPLDDMDNKTPSMYKVARQFFSNHKAECDLSSLRDDDFESLVRLCLTSDVVLIDNKPYTQNNGLAMGNNLAPSLAIIYMNQLDIQLRHQFGNNVMLKRYIDDIFLVWTSADINSDNILSVANSLNTALSFTIEMPVDDRLPFLETFVTLNRTNNSFTTQLYTKPIHSGCILHWDSHGPTSAKRAILTEKQEEPYPGPQTNPQLNYLLNK